MKYRIGLTFLFLIGLFFNGCKLETPDDASEPPRAFVDGQVQDSNDQPIADVIVEITTHQTTCEDPGVNHGTVNTDSDGEFLKVIARQQESTVSCLTLRTSSKTNRDLKDSTITKSVNLEFRFSEPLDYETVNILY